MLKSLRLTNLLSFGPDAEPIALQPLNVLIGPNGAGKSNFIEAITLLHAAPLDLLGPIREGGGAGAWIWKGQRAAKAELEAVISREEGSPLRHSLRFAEAGLSFEVVDERIEEELPRPGKDKPYFYFGYENGRPMLNVNGESRFLQRENIDPRQSVLSQRKDPEQYPEITYVGATYSAIRLYREWVFGRGSLARRPQPADLPNEHLVEDALNLGLVLNHFESDVATKHELLEALKHVYDEIIDFHVRVQAGTVQVFLQEAQWTIPATRLSDGTLRWLCLIAILLDPSPPPLICIEEPELGLHPDLMHVLAGLLVKASERAQLIVTTHSESLVDAFTDTPDVVLVCEKERGSTSMRRLDSERLSTWLEAYSLGELWRKGEFGGTRW